MNRTLILPTLVVIAILIAACGGAEEKEGTGTTATGHTSEAAAVVTEESRRQSTKAVSSGQATEVSFTVDDASMSGPDSVVSGWVRFLITNQGQNNNHLGILQLWEGKTTADLAAYIEQQPTGPLPAWATPGGGPADVAPGASGNAMLNLDAGSYALVRYVSDSSGASRPSGAGILPLTVVAGATTGEEPIPSMLVQITTGGYVISPALKVGAGLTSPVTAGPHIVKVVNEDLVPHEFRVIEMESGKSVSDDPQWEMGRGGISASGGTKKLMRLKPVIAEDGTGPTGPPPGIAVGGMMALSPGKTAYFSTDLKFGYFFVYSSLPQPDTGAPYFLAQIEELADTSQGSTDAVGSLQVTPMVDEMLVMP
jgi:hypothetical protein